MATRSGSADVALDPRAVVRAFFDALQARDHERALALIAEGAVLCRNGGDEAPLRILAHPKVVAMTEAALGRHRYEDVRTVVEGRTVVEQHRVRSTTPAGEQIDADVCAVLQLDLDGRITRLDEYADLNIS